jgi:hypothetical protein
VIVGVDTGISGIGHVGGGVGAERVSKFVRPGFTSVQFFRFDRRRGMVNFTGDWS